MIVRRCETKGAFEVIPDERVTLNLKKLSLKFKTISLLPMLVMINVDDCIVTCYKNGKLLIRNCENEKEAEEAAKNIYSIK